MLPLQIESLSVAKEVMVVYRENHTIQTLERRYRLLTVTFENAKLLKKNDALSFHI